MYLKRILMVLTGLYLFFCFITLSNAMEPELAWYRLYGIGKENFAYSIQQTSDGGYIVAGFTDSKTINKKDVYILRLDENGNKLWEKSYGGEGEDVAYSIYQTRDGEYIVAGYSESFGAGGKDFCLLKLDDKGNKIWGKTYGSKDDEVAYSIEEAVDEGYIVVGYKASFWTGKSDVYVIKLDKDGNKIWERTYGGSDNDVAHSIQKTLDGGYVVAGYSNSFGSGGKDFYVLKIDKDGNKILEKAYDKDGEEIAYCIRQTADGGYIIAGSVEKKIYLILFSIFSRPDVYILKLDRDGNKDWDRIYGRDVNSDVAYCIRQTIDGGYIVAGKVEFDPVNSRGPDIYILKLNENGDLEWEIIWGEYLDEVARCIQQTKDGGYIIAGGSREKVCVLKLDKGKIEAEIRDW